MPKSKTQASATALNPAPVLPAAVDDATLQRRRNALLPGHLPASAPAAASHDATPSKSSPPRKTVNNDANNSKPPAAVAVAFVREGAVSDVAATAVLRRLSKRPKQQTDRYKPVSSPEAAPDPAPVAAHNDAPAPKSKQPRKNANNEKNHSKSPAAVVVAAVKQGKRRKKVRSVLLALSSQDCRVSLVVSFPVNAQSRLITGF